MRILFISILWQTNLQAQIATLKSQKNSMEQEVKALETSLDAEKSQCESLKEDISEKMGEVEAVKELLDKTKEELTEMSSKAEESAINLQVLASSWKECKTALAAKEKVMALLPFVLWAVHESNFFVGN